MAAWPQLLTTNGWQTTHPDFHRLLRPTLHDGQWKQVEIHCEFSRSSGVAFHLVGCPSLPTTDRCARLLPGLPG